MDILIKNGELITSKKRFNASIGIKDGMIEEIFDPGTEPDAGEVRWKGQPVAIGSPAAARALGVGMVFQHFSLFEALTVVPCACQFSRLIKHAAGVARPGHARCAPALVRRRLGALRVHGP